MRHVSPSPNSSSTEFGRSFLEVHESTYAIIANNMIMTDEKWDHLNRPLGYEIAHILRDSKLSFAGIKRELPYEDVNDNEIARILDPDGTQCPTDVFTIPKTRGRTKYTLNRALFSEDDLERIRNRAEARIRDNLANDDRDDVMDADSNPIDHLDAQNMGSRFYRG